MSGLEPPPYPGEPTPEVPSGYPAYGSESVTPPPPPPPPPPPAPPSYGPAPFNAPDAIAWGWLKFRQNVGPVLLAALASAAVYVVVGIVSAALGGGFQVPDASTGPLPNPMHETFGFGEIVGQLLGWVVGSLVSAAWIRAALDVADGRPFAFFGGFSRIPLVKVLIASVIVGIATIIGIFLCVIPGIIVAFLTYLTNYAIVDQPEASPIDGIKRSVELVRANIGQSLLLALLTFLVFVAGVCAVCVGLLVAYPVVIFAAANAYRSFSGRPVAP